MPLYATLCRFMPLYAALCQSAYFHIELRLVLLVIATADHVSSEYVIELFNI